MKKTLIIAGIILGVLAIGLICFQLYFINSPEYALLQIKKDVEKSGIDGLRPHLTGDALETFDYILAIKNDPLLGLIGGLLIPSEYLTGMTDNLDVVSFDLEEIDRDGKKAEVTLSFNYDDRLKGTVDLNMVKTDDGWKINGLDWPVFTEVNW